MNENMVSVRVIQSGPRNGPLIQLEPSTSQQISTNEPDVRIFSLHDFGQTTEGIVSNRSKPWLVGPEPSSAPTATKRSRVRRVCCSIKPKQSSVSFKHRQPEDKALDPGLLWSMKPTDNPYKAPLTGVAMVVRWKECLKWWAFARIRAKFPQS